MGVDKAQGAPKPVGRTKFAKSEELADKMWAVELERTGAAFSL